MNSSNPVIPEAAVEAALPVYLTQCNYDAEEIVRLVLEAAAPYMLAEVWDEAIEAHKAWTWDDENMDALGNPYRPANKDASHGND